MKSKVLSRELFIASNGKGGVTGGSYYADLTGTELFSVHSYSTRSDSSDSTWLRHSPDNGRSWGPVEEIVTARPMPRGMWRQNGFVCCIHPPSGRLVSFVNQGVLPSDDAMEGGLQEYKLHYSVSQDGGKSTLISAPVICSGREFDERHPIPGVVVGRNSFLIGDRSCAPIVLGDGTILQPFQITPVDENGKIYNPANGLKYRDSAVLRGTMHDDGHITWEVSERIVGDPTRTTRGVLEPTIAELSDGRILLVMRGSNDTSPPQELASPDAYLPGYKWYSLSSDQGRTWSTPAPWTNTKNKNFFSPSSCSQLVPHSSGRLFWLGNVSTQNVVGNRPRYPMMLAEVDRASGLIVADSSSVIDTKSEDDAPMLQLSCFYAREDRETGHLLLHMPRMFATSPPEGQSLNWNSNLYLYRIEINA